MQQNLIESADRASLLNVANEAILHGLDKGGGRLAVDPARYAPTLQCPGASFVTLKVHGKLRGCIGRLEPVRTLVEDVAWNAHSSAFEDMRFPTISRRELPALSISISILFPAVPLAAGSEEELIRELKPGIDGLILEEDNKRATLLPSVWEALPDPRSFLDCLKKKAGLPGNYWSASMRFKRYRTQTFESWK